MKATRKTVPAPLDPVPFNIPPAFKTTLNNGLRIILFEDSRLPLVSFRLAFLSGDIHDPADSIGLTSAVSAMLTEGTQHYTSLQLAEKIERLGASLSANASEDFSAISASALSLYRDELLELIGEIAFRPTFPENELDLYRRNTIEQLKFQRSQPGFLASEQISRLIYGTHPYSRVSPTASDIERLDREKLQEGYERTFVPNNALFIAIGDVDRKSFVGRAEEAFGKWERRDLPVRDLGSLPERSSRTLTIVDRPGSAQSNIVLANRAIDRLDPDYFPLLVMNQILGAGASSRVFMNLREEKGYTYGAYTRIETKRLAGDFEATAEVRTGVTGDSLKEFFYELDRIRSEKATEQELDDARNFLTGVFPIRAETQEGLTGLIVNQELYGLPDDYLQTYRDNVNAVTLEDVMAAANKYVLPEKMAIVIVGDAEAVLPQVRQFSSAIEVFDTEGSPVEIAKYTPLPDEASAEVAGNWDLSLDFQGSKVPISMMVEHTGSQISGKLQTMFGDGVISGGSVSGTRFSATANTEIQGQSVDLVIACIIHGDDITGTITSGMLPVPLEFTGNRKI